MPAGPNMTEVNASARTPATPNAALDLRPLTRPMVLEARAPRAGTQRRLITGNSKLSSPGRASTAGKLRTTAGTRKS